MDPEVLRKTLHEIAIADAQIVDASARRAQAWLVLFPDITAPATSTSETTVGVVQRKRTAGVVNATGGTVPKRARADPIFDPLTERLWKSNFGAVIQWHRDANLDAPLVLIGHPTPYAMPSDQMRALTDMRVANLRIESCKLAAFAPVVDVNATLHTIVIYNNAEFYAFDNSFAGLKVLAHLDVSFCTLVRLPENIGVMTTLRHLDLNHNNLTHLPKSFEQLVHLEYLNLSSNHIKSANFVVKFTKLQNLYLANCKLVSLPSDIGALQDLRHLELGKNDIKSLPKSIGQLKHLEAIDLDNNWIGPTNAMKELAGCTALTTMVLKAWTDNRFDGYGPCSKMNREWDRLANNATLLARRNARITLQCGLRHSPNEGRPPLGVMQIIAALVQGKTVDEAYALLDRGAETN